MRQPVPDHGVLRTRLQSRGHVAPGRTCGYQFGLAAAGTEHPRCQDVGQRRYRQKRAVGVPQHVGLQVEGVGVAFGRYRVVGAPVGDVVHARPGTVLAHGAILHRSEQGAKGQMALVIELLVAKQQQRMFLECCPQRRVVAVGSNVAHVQAVNLDAKLGMQG